MSDEVKLSELYILQLEEMKRRLDLILERAKQSHWQEEHTRKLQRIAQDWKYVAPRSVWTGSR
jgi:hypothetical protein